MNKKIYFILNSVEDAHSLKRVKDFSGLGAEEKVFGFLRNSSSTSIDGVTVIGSFSNTLSYRKRVAIYFKGIRRLFKKYKEKDIVWYYLGLDVAWVATLLSPGRKYIYEECDLVHAYIGNRLVYKIFERMDKMIIRKAFRSILTSEGFIEFHYKDSQIPLNIVLTENKLSDSVLNYQYNKTRKVDTQHLRFAFVGGMRYKALLSIADIITRNFPQHSFDFYGFIAPKFSKDELPERQNVHYYGSFQSPQDLPAIYNNVDVVVATYDTFTVNEKCAEPNKLYEAIYFRCPIIVSSGTFIAEKVRRLGIGYSVDAYNRDEVINLVYDIESDIQQTINNIGKINPAYAIGSDKYAVDIVKSINDNDE